MRICGERGKRSGGRGTDREREDGIIEYTVLYALVMKTRPRCIRPDAIIIAGDFSVSVDSSTQCLDTQLIRCVVKVSIRR